MAFRPAMLGVVLLSFLALASLFFAVALKSLGAAGLGLVLVAPAAMVAWLLRVDDVRGFMPLDRQG